MRRSRHTHKAPLPVLFSIAFPKKEEVVVSPHAATRYAQRISPQLSQSDAEEEIRVGYDGLVWSEDRPSWLPRTSDLNNLYGTFAFLVGHINGALMAFPVARHDGQWVARTCLVHGVTNF